MKKIICFFLGHKVTPMIVEDSVAIYTNGCKRCKCGIGFPFWKIYDYPPPPAKQGQSQEERNASWKKFLDERYEEIRNSLQRNK